MPVGTSVRGNTSEVVDCHAGICSAEAAPKAKVSINSDQGPMSPEKVKPAIAATLSTIPPEVTSSRRRRSTRSASMPPGRLSRNAGRVVAVWISATISGDGVSEVMSQAAPTFCIQMPM